MRSDNFTNIYAISIYQFSSILDWMLVCFIGYYSLSEEVTPTSILVSSGFGSKSYRFIY